MRTKTVVLAALCGLIGASASEAQSVYSVNAVGYVNIPFTQNVYQMFSNPLSTTNNTIAALFPAPPDGTLLYTWTASGYNIATFASFLGGWDQPNITINPGQGAFLLPAANFTNTFVGEVLQGALSNPFPVGYSMVSSMVPQAGTLDDLGLTAAVQDGDLVYQWTAASGYVIYTYASFLGGWQPNVPSLGVGESVFVLSGAGGNWQRTFNINN